MTFYIKKENDIVIDPYSVKKESGFKEVSIEILEKLYLFAMQGNKVNQKRNLSYCKVCKSKVSYHNCNDFISDYMIKVSNEQHSYLIPSLIFHTVKEHDATFPEDLIDIILEQ